MKTSKKILCLLLSVVMLATLSLPAFAATYIHGEEIEGKINYKYEVAKVSEVSMPDDSGTYTGDDIYAVTIYMKCNVGVDIFNAGIRFDKNHYAPIMLIDGTDVYAGYDGWYDDMGESTVYLYSYGEAWNHTAMYRSTGAVATSKALASVIGLGNANAVAVTPEVAYYSTDTPQYNNTHAETEDNIGFISICLDDSGNLKNAYLNVTEGITVNTDWVRMITVYFQRLPGVTDEDCIGDVFGAIPGLTYTGIDGTTDASGAPSRIATTYVLGNPGCTVVSNAVVTASVPAGPAVAKSKAEVKMTPNSATTVEDAFSFRVTSVITDADWDTYFANSGDPSATANAIQSVGFVAYKGTTGFDLDTAKAVAQGTPATGYDVATTDYVQKADDASDAYFGCRVDITSAETRSDVTYVAFVEYLDASGNTAYAFYDAEQQALLNTNYASIVDAYLAVYPFAG